MECNHKFKIIENRIVCYTTFFLKRKSFGQVYTLQCSKCGGLTHSRHSLGDSFKEASH